MSLIVTVNKPSRPTRLQFYNPINLLLYLVAIGEFLMAEIEDLQAEEADLAQAQADEAVRQQAADQAEQAREQALSDQVAQLNQHVADLEAQLAAGGLSPEQAAAITAVKDGMKQVADNLRAEAAA